jgi:SAM-dependent methyltransferase
MDEKDTIVPSKEDSLRSEESKIFGRMLNEIIINSYNTIYNSTNGAVTSGPFSGMRLVPKSIWGSGDFGPKLLGTYEEELHPAILGACARLPELVLNIGCAEGYYAIGLARLLESARIIGFDIDERAQAMLQENAIANGIANVNFRGICTHSILQEMVSSVGRAFLFVDCEGCERELLDPAYVPALERAEVIVECHDFVNRDITQTLVGRFNRTHVVNMILQEGRNPNRFPVLARMPETVRWLALSEGRPERMHWLHMIPKAPLATPDSSI